MVVVTRRVPMTRGAALRSRVKGNFQARFWNSGGQGDSPTDCSKLSEHDIKLTKTIMTAGYAQVYYFNSPMGKAGRCSATFSARASVDKISQPKFSKNPVSN